MTDELKNQIIAARKAGKPYKEIAEMFGLSRPYVNNICRAAGLKKRKYRWKSLVHADRENRLKEISHLLLCKKTETPLVCLGKIMEEMAEAGVGGTFYSEGNLGLSITSAEIEVVDMLSGPIATIQVHIRQRKEEAT